MNNKIILVVLILFGVHASSIAMDKEEHLRVVPFLQGWPPTSEGRDMKRKLYEGIGTCPIRQGDLRAINSGHLMSDQEKLDNIFSDEFFPQRKKIIKKMIVEGHHPDSIVYQWDKRTPLEEAVVYRDEKFFNFLLERGVTLRIDRRAFMQECIYDYYQAGLNDLIKRRNAQKKRNINIVNGIELDLDDID